MAILVYDSQDQVPEDLRSMSAEVTEDGENKGKWTVNVVPRKKLEEFRDTNTETSKKLESATAFQKKLFSTLGVEKPEEFDFDKFGEQWSNLNDTARKVSDGKLKASDDIDKVVVERTEAMRQKFDTELQAKQVELNAMKQERDSARADFKRTFIDRAVSQAVLDADLGVEGTAADDIRVRAYGVFKVEDDGTIRPEKNGQTMWGEDGSTPMTMKEWISLVLRKEAPHYFKKSGGGGASGGEGNVNYGGMSEEEFNKLPARTRLEIANKASFQGNTALKR